MSYAICPSCGVRTDEPSPACRWKHPSYSEIECLPLSTRAVKALKAGGLLTIAQIVAGGRDGLVRTPRIGRKTADEIVAVLSERGVMVKSRQNPMSWYLSQLRDA